MIPGFNIEGALPAGVHRATWNEFKARYGANTHRSRIIGGMLEALRSLKAAGCQTVYIDGSFVTEKALPNDFDGCWDIRNVDPAKLDPILLTFANRRAAQKAKFKGELFPTSIQAVSGRTYLEFFQHDSRTGNRKGIVEIDLLTETL